MCILHTCRAQSRCDLPNSILFQDFDCVVCLLNLVILVTRVQHDFAKFLLLDDFQLDVVVAVVVVVVAVVVAVLSVLRIFSMGAFFREASLTPSAVNVSLSSTPESPPGMLSSGWSGS